MEEREARKLTFIKTCTMLHMELEKKENRTQAEEDFVTSLQGLADIIEDLGKYKFIMDQVKVHQDAK